MDCKFFSATFSAINFAFSTLRFSVSSFNCSVSFLALVLYPLVVSHKISRIVISTFQSISGAGKNALDNFLQKANCNLENNLLRVQTPKNRIPISE